MIKRLSIDPGDEHVGWAYDGPEGVDAGEWRPTEATDRLTRLLTLDAVDEVILEEFKLYSREYANQTWSEMKTPQLIGAIKLICHWFRVPVVMQGAYIKKPTRAKMRRLGIKHHPGSIHSRDAELHLYNRKMRSHER